MPRFVNHLACALNHGSCPWANRHVYWLKQVLSLFGLALFAVLKRYRILDGMGWIVWQAALLGGSRRAVLATMRLLECRAAVRVATLKTMREARFGAIPFNARYS